MRLPNLRFRMNRSDSGIFPLRAGALSVLLALVLACGPRNHAPDVPAIPIGPSYGLPDSTYSYSTSATDPDGDFVVLQVSWGDSTLSDWSGVVAGGAQAIWGKDWHSAGRFEVRVRARDTRGGVSDWSQGLNVDVVNTAALPLSPLPPIGPDSVKAGFIEEFLFPTRGPSGESLVLDFDWDDGRSPENWWPSRGLAGDTLGARYVFDRPGNRHVGVRAYDPYLDRCSNWATGAGTKVVNVLGGGWKRNYHAYEVQSVSRTSDCGLVLAGHYGGAFLARTDSSGRLLWSRSYDSARGTVMSATQTADGGYVVVSAGRGPWFPAGLYLLRADQNGDFRWLRYYSYGNESEFPGMYGRCVRPTPDGGCILGASTVLMKVDSCGDSTWAIECGANGVELTPDGGYIACGYGATLTKTDAAGVIQWQRNYNHAFEQAFSVRLVDRDGYILVGTVPVATCEDSLLLIRVSSDGTPLWRRVYFGLYGTVGWDVGLAQDGGYFAGGLTCDFGLFYLARFDAMGYCIWQRVLSYCDGWVENVSVLPTADNGCLFPGEDEGGAALWKVDENGGIGPAGYEAGLPAGAGVRGGTRIAQRAKAERLRSAMRGR